MKTSIVLSRGQQSARIVATYTNPLEDVSLKFEGDSQLLGVYYYYSLQEPTGYFIGDADPTNIEHHMNLLPTLRLRHGIVSRVIDPPDLSAYYEESDDPSVVY